MDVSLTRKVLLMLTATCALSALAQEAKKAEPLGDPNVLMKCIYTPAADSQSSSLPTYSVGFKFSLLRNLENQIAVDAYTLNDKSQPIKQIGHAELIGSASTVSTATKASEILSILQLSEDSPFDFAISFASATTASETPLSAVIDVVTVFTGETFTSLPVQCKLAPAPKEAPVKN